jgi:hypothetical protein
MREKMQTLVFEGLVKKEQSFILAHSNIPTYKILHVEMFGWTLIPFFIVSNCRVTRNFCSKKVT